MVACAVIGFMFTLAMAPFWLTAVRGIPMVTAMEYRELALKFYRWAAESETEEVRDTYLRLARGWTLAALGVNDLSASPYGHPIVTATRH